MLKRSVLVTCKDFEYIPVGVRPWQEGFRTVIQMREHRPLYVWQGDTSDRPSSLAKELGLVVPKDSPPAEFCLSVCQHVACLPVSSSQIPFILFPFTYVNLFFIRKNFLFKCLPFFLSYWFFWTLVLLVWKFENRTFLRNWKFELRKGILTVEKRKPLKSGHVGWLAFDVKK